MQDNNREYVKINSLWKRHGCDLEKVDKVFRDTITNKKDFIVGEYSKQEFGNIKKWHVEEKIDGTNIRVTYKNGSIYIEGRTSAAQLPCHLLHYLQETFTPEIMQKVFPVEPGDDSMPKVTLFGEGYGPKIQSCGGNYRSTPGFILFDVFVGGWWLKREDVKSIADKIGVPTCPEIGVMEECEIVEYIKSNPLSLCSKIPHVMEGVVCRSYPLVLFRDGTPVMWKLKCKDFQ